LTRVSLIELDGDIDLARAPELREELRGSVHNQDVGLIVDLSAVRYLDSAGVNVLFEVAGDLTTRRIALAVVVPEGGLLDRVVELVNLRAVARIERTVDDAVAAFDD
jgi:stage II sporulation protein AA (anti-sigma F factor antagonist)